MALFESLLALLLVARADRGRADHRRGCMDRMGLTEELDWAELHASPREEWEMLDA